MKFDARHLEFERLHQSGCFAIPNPWDIGTAKLMAGLGAKALATTSSGHAFTLGRADMGNVTRDEALSHAQDLMANVEIPVSGDFENGFGDDPQTVAETVKLAGEIGLSGCSIEDTMMISAAATSDGELLSGNPAYDFDLAVDRISAGASAARALKRPFVFCARADGYMNGAYDFAEALRRAIAFENAGADLIYVPLLRSIDELKTMRSALKKPINVLAVGALQTYGLSALEDAGARRISIGGAMARKAQGLTIELTKEILGQGQFLGLANGATETEVNQLLTRATS